MKFFERHTLSHDRITLCVTVYSRGDTTVMDSLVFVIVGRHRVPFQLICESMVLMWTSTSIIKKEYGV